ncbi:hypothetical protein PEX2_006510 [Penicillium expansum]|uniref:Uncharacterized protein n=1 Tax=Penicillium expansum TaxID=27334 RepID=A0A0A2JGY7_PENEN|nr:hypothetical protein PEX2_006510 [Penicillium expansum]KGO44720.1 hypothetical protein PEXP_019920 [Penicillium expansum]KGO51575.1 hypothetical protein PEX2_006510 [Penicillium expansum]
MSPSQEFYQAIRSLRKLTDQPSEEHSYRMDIPSFQSANHLLKVEDEMQFADDIAFLAQWQEGVEYVTAVTLQEMANGLVIRIASNHTPTDKTVRELKGTMALVSEYASKGKRRDEFRDKIFDKIVDIRDDRILNRIRPPWLPQPERYVKRRPFLLAQVRAFVDEISAIRSHSPAFQILVQPARQLISCLLPFKKPIPESIRKEHQKNVIKACAELANIGGTGLLEEHLHRLQVPPHIRDRGGIRQIDKLARYFFVCRDFIKVGRRPEYKPLFSNISIETLKAFEGWTPAGSSSMCFVHAEIQQIVHYTNHPYNPSPRFIGCSKSACYLCDMFIQKHSQYRISHAHRRLYDKWTLPNLDYSTSQEAQQLQTILQSMTEEMEITAKGFQRSLRPPKQYGAESIAFLPLTSGSTASNTSIATRQLSIPHVSPISSLKSDYNTKIATTSFLRTRSEGGSSRTSNASYLLLGQDDLPYSLNIKDIRHECLIRIGAIFLDIELVTPGRLSIRHAMDNPLPRDVIDICQLSTITETKVTHNASLSNMQLFLRHSRGLTIILDFVRDEA